MRESSAEQRSCEDSRSTEVEFLGNYYGWNKQGYDGDVYDRGGCSPTLVASCFKGRTPKIIEVFKKGKDGTWQKLND